MKTAMYSFDTSVFMDWQARYYPPDVFVSQETSAAEKRNAKRTHYIPDVCRDLGIPCIYLLGLMRREKWTI